MVKYSIYYGDSLGKDGVKSTLKTKKLQTVKDYLYLFSGCSTIDIDEYAGTENRWFGSYFVEVE
ncbi:MAG: hypothetical protein ACRDCC_06360 [Culicoidibacterales bacterium]